jgi:beta-lactamase class A
MIRLLLPLLLLFGFSAAMGAGDPVCDLSSAEDAELQRGLDELLAEEGLSTVAARGDLALTVLVLTNESHPRLAQVNGHRMLYAASLPKITILLGAAVALDRGRLTLDAGLRDDIHRMIRYSCNDCSNRVLERVGERELLALLQSPRYGFYDGAQGGGLWLGKAYGPGPAWQRDPLHGLSHGATTFQASRFYCGLHRGTLVSPRQTRLMLEALAQPGISHKFVKGLEPFGDIELFRKSGTWQTWHADSALVRDDEQVYVIAGLVHSPDGGEVLERLARPLHDLAHLSDSSD